MKIDPVSTNYHARRHCRQYLDRLAANPRLTDSRKRDLRSAVTCFAKLMDQQPARSRWISPRSGTISIRLYRLGRRFPRSGGRISAATLPPLSTPPACTRCSTPPVKPRPTLGAAPGRRRPVDAPGLSRFARWATLHRIAPHAVDESTIERFVAELHASPGSEISATALALFESAGTSLSTATEPFCRRSASQGGRTRPEANSLEQLPASLRQDVDALLVGRRCPTPLMKALGQGPSARALCGCSRSTSIPLSPPPSPPALPSTSSPRSPSLVEPETFRVAPDAIAGNRTAANCRRTPTASP